MALMLLKLREEAGAPLPRATWLLDSVPGSKLQIVTHSRPPAGLAPRISFIFPPFPRDGGRKRSEGRGTLSKIRGNRGEKGGRGGGRRRKRVGSIFWGEGSLIFILRVEEPP